MTPDTTYWQDGKGLYELVDADADLVIIRNSLTEEEHVLTTVDFGGRFTVVKPAKETA